MASVATKSISTTCVSSCERCAAISPLRRSVSHVTTTARHNTKAPMLSAKRAHARSRPVVHSAAWLLNDSEVLRVGADADTVS